MHRQVREIGYLADNGCDPKVRRGSPAGGGSSLPRVHRRTTGNRAGDDLGVGHVADRPAYVLNEFRQARLVICRDGVPRRLPVRFSDPLRGYATGRPAWLENFAL
jgi:hypothetical protein